MQQGANRAAIPAMKAATKDAPSSSSIISIPSGTAAPPRRRRIQSSAPHKLARAKRGRRSERLPDGVRPAANPPKRAEDKYCLRRPEAKRILECLRSILRKAPRRSREPPRPFWSPIDHSPPNPPIYPQRSLLPSIPSPRRSRTTEWPRPARTAEHKKCILFSWTHFSFDLSSPAYHVKNAAQVEQKTDPEQLYLILAYEGHHTRHPKDGQKMSQVMRAAGNHRGSRSGAGHSQYSASAMHSGNKSLEVNIESGLNAETGGEAQNEIPELRELANRETPPGDERKHGEIQREKSRASKRSV